MLGACPLPHHRRRYEEGVDRFSRLKVAPNLQVL